MMTEFVKHIAETEGVITPRRKRSKKEVAAAFEDFTKKRSKSKKPKPDSVISTKSLRDRKKAEAEKAKAAKPVSKPAAIADIDRTKVTANGGNVISAGYDAKTSRLHIEFDRSIWEYPNTKADEWKGLQATLTDKAVDTGAYFRKAFRGRAATSRRVYDRKATNGASKEAPAQKQAEAA